MKYENIVEGKFISRPNRFIANVEIDGAAEVCHVKNTGRCRELLTEGCTVWLARADNPNRRTRYDLVAVRKGELLINMDSYAPNLAAGEFLRKMLPEAVIRPEYTYGGSRFDFYIEYNSKKIFLEVKGVTLERDGAVLFPDAPTQRGTKHLRELIRLRGEGYGACLLFVVQMAGAKYFTPNDGTDPVFGETLRLAAEKGVTVLAYGCDVRTDGMEITEPVPVRLEKYY